MSKVDVACDESGLIDTISMRGVHIEMLDDDEMSMHIGDRLFTVTAMPLDFGRAKLHIVDLDAGFKKAAK